LKSLVIVVGLPGVGKSTVLGELEKEASKQGLKIQIVNYGTVMMSLAEESGRQVAHRDEMRKRSTSFQRELQAEAARRIASMAEAFDGVTLVDTHMIVKAGSGYLPGLPSHVLSLLKPSLIALKRQLTGAPMMVVENLEGKAGEAAGRLLEAIKGVKG